MIEFHDYLIRYRLTPRSRILRKHLPKMTMVLEEQESMMDSSSVLMSQSRVESQSRLMSVSQHTKDHKKFKYPISEPLILPDGSVLLDPEQEDTSSDSSGDNGITGDDYDDLKQLDAEQVDFIRKINKGGSMAFSS